MERKIAIVGAGISGLLACKYVLSKGYCPTVFESESHVGGVWVNTMDITRLQTPKTSYQFSDYPWSPSINDMHPKGDEVLEYLRSYAEHFDLLKHVRHNAKVLSIDYEGVSDSEMEAWSLWGGNGEPFGNKGKWTLLLQDVSTHSEQFDFVILCIGQFSNVPNMPEFPPNEGPEMFRGKVMHSKEYASLDYQSARNLVTGKRVVVVGRHKSAIDVATECSIANGKERPCHMMYRRSPSWIVPNFTTWRLPVPYLFFNRFAELLFHKPGEGLFLSLLATLLLPLRWLIRMFVESAIIGCKHPLKRFGFVRGHSIVEAVHSCFIAILPEGFCEKIEKGSIILKKASKFSLCKQGVMVEAEEKPIESDLVIFATGFKGDIKLRNIFSSPKFQRLVMGSPNSIFPFYRHCIHPRVPQLAVIGFAESVSNLQSSEMRCRWLAELLDGTFKLPQIQAMEEDISKWDKYLKMHSRKRHIRRTCIEPINIWYNDQLCKDIGWNPRRKKGLISELFEPYGPLDNYISTRIISYDAPLKCTIISPLI